MSKQIVCYDYFGVQHVFDESAYIPRESAYIALIDQGRILMVKDAVSGRWELPGGGVESGEDVLRALQRELYEETGLSIDGQLTPLAAVIEYFYDITSKQPWKATRRFYIAHTYHGDLIEHGNGDDVSLASFVSSSELGSLQITSTIREVVRQAFGATQ